MIAVVAMGVCTRFYWKRYLMESQGTLEHTEPLSETNGIQDGADQRLLETKGFQDEQIEELPETKGIRPDQIERLPETQETHGNAVTSSEAQKIMLLNAYPIIYIILWLPGMANRVAEATGHEIRVLIIMQSSTTYIGLAHAVMFGWNEVRHQFTVQKLLEMLLGFVLGS